VQTFGQSRYEQERFEEHSRNAMVAALESVGLEARFSWVVGVVEAVSISAVVWVGNWLVGRHGLSVGTLVFFIILIQNMFKPTRKIIKQWATIGKLRASAERVAEVLARQPSVRDLPGATEAPPLRGELEFRHVSFAYRPDPGDAAGATPDDPAKGLVLDDVSFHVHAGEVVALVGPSGAGKSTIAQLVPRLYDPDGGAVCVDGCDIRSFTLDALRRQISLVLQALRRLMKGKTTIIISHDLDLIRSADRIMVIRDGRIVQTGRHEELLREGGPYADLYAGWPGHPDRRSGGISTVGGSHRKRGLRP